MAFQAGDVMMQGDAIADFEFFDSRADFGDDAGSFMTENTRWRKGRVLDFFDVRGTDSAGGDFHQQFTRADAWDSDGFEAKIVWTAIHDGAHGFGQGKHCRILAADCTDDTDFLGEQGLGLQRRGAKIVERRREAKPEDKS